MQTIITSWIDKHTCCNKYTFIFAIIKAIVYITDIDDIFIQVDYLSTTIWIQSFALKNIF